MSESPQHLEPVPFDDELFHRAHAMSATGRVVLGLCGLADAGTEVLAERLVRRFGADAVVVPMDGFRLHDDELARRDLGDHPGTPEAFDVSGYLALLRRLRTEATHTVYAPAFDRSRELAVAGAVAVRPEHRLVVTEGPYLLYDAPGWSDIHALLDEVWFVEQPRDPGLRAASELANAELVVRTRERADLVVRVD